MLQTSHLKRSGRELISLTLTIVLVGLGFPSFAPSSAHVTPKATVAQDDVLPFSPIPAGSAYRQTNFVSDSPGVATVLDPLLVNPWGISKTPTVMTTPGSPFWVANNGTSTSTLYRGDFCGAPLAKNAGFPAVSMQAGNGLPTGTVANPNSPASGFVVTSGAQSGPAIFMFATITGSITGWNPGVATTGGTSTTAVRAINLPGHVYTGLAVTDPLAATDLLYAADFANGNIDVFNSSFVLQPPASFPFADPTIPAAYNPHNIQEINGALYVTYALPGPDGFQVPGVGNGFVRRFDYNGVRDLTFGINNGPLNAPWGIVIADPDFGIFGNALLVGNFGPGNPSIHAFNPTTGAFLGTLQNDAGVGIEIPGLWALTFGNGGNGGNPDTLYFTAGLGGLRNEDKGLFGSLNPTNASALQLIQLGSADVAIGEGLGHIDITVTRTGNVSGTATVNYATFDEPLPDHASQKSDYQISLGKLTFNPGETSKTFRVLIVNDDFDENDEEIGIVLSNPTGTGVGLGSPNTGVLTLLDNDSGAPTSNIIDDAQFFVSQHYRDFLNRPADAGGLAFWSGQITACGSDAACIARKRVDVSGAFFQSIEFQATGFTAYRTHNAAFGGRPLYGQFMRDTQALQKDFIFLAPGADAQLEANKQAYFNDFVLRPDFVQKYPSTQTNAQYVDALLISAGLSPSNFFLNMTNAQENPPAFPSTSGGARRPASFGPATFSLNAAETALTFTATVNNIDFTGTQTPGDPNDNLIAAHIHAGPSVTPTTNGPVVWGFFGNPFNDTIPPVTVLTPFLSGVGGTVAGTWDAAEGNNTTLTAQLANLKEGRAYINFHTTQFTGGEIRGQFPAMTAFRNSLVAGLDGATETRASVLRKVSESTFLGQRELNNAFVQMEYFGYLRRDEDPAGFAFWLDKLLDFNGDFRTSEMVKAFIESIEYRQRFGA